MKSIIVGKNWKQVWNTYEDLEPERWYHRWFPIKRKMIKYTFSAFVKADDQVKINIDKNEISSDKHFVVSSAITLIGENVTNSKV